MTGTNHPILNGQMADLDADTFDQIVRFMVHGIPPREPNEFYLRTCEDTTCGRTFTTPHRGVKFCPKCMAYGELILSHYIMQESRWGVRPV